MSNRVACAYIPNFPIRVIQKFRPHTVGKPLALTDNERPKSPIVALNESAYQSGVRRGVARARAKSICPNLEVIPRDIEGEISVSNSILKALQGVAPNIEEEKPGLYFLDTGGLTLIYKSERVLARKILSNIRYLLFSAKVGIAKNKFLARVAAEVSKISDFTVVTAGTERKFLSGLPSGYLRMTDETRERLSELGIDTIGEVAEFGHNELTLRFGEEGSRIAANSNAEDLNLFSPEHFPESLSRRSQHLHAVTDIDQILRKIETLLDELFGKIRVAGRVTSCVQVKLRLENKNDVYLKASVSIPTAMTSKFIRQISNELGKTKFEAGVVEVMVTIPSAVTQFSDQMDITSGTFTRGNPLGNLDRSTLPDAGKMCLPILSDSYLPEKSFIMNPLLDKAEKVNVARGMQKQMHPYSRSMISGLRLLQPAKETRMILKEDNPDVIFQNRKREKIAKKRGPWRLSGGWWESAFDRLYYEIETKDRKRYLMYYDNILSRWFLHGIYD